MAGRSPAHPARIAPGLADAAHPGMWTRSSWCRTGPADGPGRPPGPARGVASPSPCPLALAAGGCGSGGGGPAGGDESEVGGASVPDRLDVPLGTDPAAVAPYVDDLLGASYNESVNLITATPTLARRTATPRSRPTSDAARARQRHRRPGHRLLAKPGRDRRVDASVQPRPAGVRYAARRPGRDRERRRGPFPTCNEVAFETVNARDSGPTSSRGRPCRARARRCGSATAGGCAGSTGSPREPRVQR